MLFFLTFNPAQRKCYLLLHHSKTLEGCVLKILLEVVQHQTAGQQHGRGVGDVLVCNALPGVSCSLDDVGNQR